MGNITYIDAGLAHSLAVDRDGYVWAWGADTLCFEGDCVDPNIVKGTCIDGICAGESYEENVYPKKVLKGDMTWSSSDFLENIYKVASGRSGNYSLACDRQGNAWAWGYNYCGQLGCGTLEEHPTPVRVIGPAGQGGHLSDIIDVDAAGSHSIALDSHGHVWTWGANANGGLGNNSTIDSAFPVQVIGPDLDAIDGPDQPGFLEDIVEIAVSPSGTSFAVDREGHVWSWGSDSSSGLLGIGSEKEWSDCPVKVRGGQQNTLYLSGIIAISAGANHVLALESDGDVWAWGASPQLGAGGIGSSDVPVQVKKIDATGGSLTAIQVDAGYFHSMAIGEENIYWSWGDNESAPRAGKLGLGDYKDEYYAQIFKLGSVHNETTGFWYATIKEAIDNAVNGNKIVVYPNTYNEYINLGQKNIELVSSDPGNPAIAAKTIIDGAGLNENLVTFGNGNTSTLSGFTITNAYSGRSAVYCSGASPKITHNLISNNMSGGIYCESTGLGLDISNNIIYANGYVSDDKAIYISDARGSIKNNTIVFNAGYGIYRAGAGIPDIRNCIIWGNNINLSDVVATDCGIDSDTGTNFIIDGTEFVDLDEGDYHLKALKTNGDPNPCINRGPAGQSSSELDFDGDPRILGGKIDVGADEFVPYLVNAGKDQTILMSESAHMDDANASPNNGVPDPPDPNTIGYQWSMISGPTDGEPDFGGTQTDRNAQVSFNRIGSYLLRLAVYDNNDLLGMDSVRVNVQYDIEVVSIPSAATTNMFALSACTIQASGPEFDYIWMPQESVVISAPIGRAAAGQSFSTNITFKESGEYTIILILVDRITGLQIGHKEIPFSIPDVPETIVRARAGRSYADVIDGPYFAIYPGEAAVYLDGQHTPLSDEPLYQWTCLEWPGGTSEPILPQRSDTKQCSVTLNSAGCYKFKLSVFCNGELAGSDEVEVILLSGRPLVSAGRNYPIIATGRAFKLNKAYIFDDSEINTANIRWSCQPNSNITWNPANTEANNPNITFQDEDFYDLTISYHDADYPPVTDTVTIQAVNAVYVYAGGPKTIVPFVPLPIDNANVDPAGAGGESFIDHGLSYEWIVDGNNSSLIRFQPSNTVLNPTITYLGNAVGAKFTLTLKVNNQEPPYINTDSAEFTVSRNPFVDEDGAPRITNCTATGTCGAMQIHANATDKNIDRLYIKVGNVELARQTAILIRLQVRQNI